MLRLNSQQKTPSPHKPEVICPISGIKLVEELACILIITDKEKKYIYRKTNLLYSFDSSCGYSTLVFSGRTAITKVKILLA
ncbi:MAG TPA: hypothetical protein V6D11_05200 [Waterburya sp.]|jgi:hypothetical protein